MVMLPGVGVSPRQAEAIGVPTGGELAFKRQSQASLGRPMANKLHALGAPRAGYVWGANAREVDMATPPAKPVPLGIAAAPQNITIDIKRSAMVVIDMQNDFCTKGGWCDYLGVDVDPDRKPIKPP